MELRQIAYQFDSQAAKQEEMNKVLISMEMDENK
jgi:hypothetical protein